MNRIQGERFEHVHDVSCHQVRAAGRESDQRIDETYERWGIRAKSNAILAVALALREIAAAVRDLVEVKREGHKIVLAEHADRLARQRACGILQDGEIP